MKENFFEKIKKGVKTGVAIGTFTAASVLPSKNLEAQNVHKDNLDKNKTEQSTATEHTNKIQWAAESMKKMKDDINELKTAEDVATFERLVLNPFVYNIGMLSDGKEVQNNYSMDEYKMMLLDVEQIKEAFELLEKKLKVEQSGGVYNNIQYLLKILNMRTSYSGFHEYKKLYNLE